MIDHGIRSAKSSTIGTLKQFLLSLYANKKMLNEVLTPALATQTLQTIFDTTL